MNIRALGHIAKGSHIVGFTECRDPMGFMMRVWSLARFEGTLRIVFNYDNLHGPNSAHEYYDNQTFKEWY